MAIAQCFSSKENPAHLQEYAMKEIPRIVEEMQQNILAKMTTMVLSLPRPLTDAITVFPGRGENERLQHAVKVWEADRAMRFFLVAGTKWSTEKTTAQPTMELLSQSQYGLKTTSGVVIHHHANITTDQTGWVVPKIQELGITSIGLVVTPYHLIRAYLTLLKETLKADLQIPIIPLPVPKAPNVIVPEDNTDAWTLFDGEMERILTYQKKGDVATLGELKKYLAWLWQHPLLKQ